MGSLFSLIVDKLRQLLDEDSDWSLVDPEFPGAYPANASSRSPQDACNDCTERLARGTLNEAFICSM